RAIRILDGGVAIFDAVAGVQAQSETVWRQAQQQALPLIAFINKMDREGASLSRTVDMMKDRLAAVPLVLQLPLGGGAQPLDRIIDLVGLNLLSWNVPTGSRILRRKLTPEDADLFKSARQLRKALVAQLADLDDDLGERYASFRYNFFF